MVVPLIDLLKRSPMQVQSYLSKLRTQYQGIPEGEIPASDVSFRKLMVTLPIPLISLYDQERFMCTIPQTWTFSDYLAFLGRDRMKAVLGFQQQQAQQQQIQQGYFPAPPQSQMPQFGRQTA